MVNYELLANIVAVLHGSLIMLVYLGIFSSIRIKWLRPLEALALLFAVGIWSLYGGCPLTFAESYLRQKTLHPLPLNSIGFIPYYLQVWLGISLSAKAVTITTYAISILFLVLTFEWLEPIMEKWISPAKKLKRYKR